MDPYDTNRTGRSHPFLRETDTSDSDGNPRGMSPKSIFRASKSSVWSSFRSSPLHTTASQYSKPQRSASCRSLSEHQVRGGRSLFKGNWKRELFRALGVKKLDKMYVVKRDGRKEDVSLDKVTNRIKALCQDPFRPYEKKDWIKPHVHVYDDNLFCTGGKLTNVDPILVAQKVCGALRDGITTVELDDFAAESALHLWKRHPEYEVLASRIEVSNLHKSTAKTFAEAVMRLKERLHEDFYNVVFAAYGPGYDKDLATVLEAEIDYTKDYQYDYFAIKTAEKQYLLQDKHQSNVVVERPQHMLMRVSLWIHMKRDSGRVTVDLPAVLETYKLLSERSFTHASPTLFNAGTKTPQNSSCFLVGRLGTRESDSIKAMYGDAIPSMANISRVAGGIGIHMHEIRAAGAWINGTGGTSTGLIPYLKVVNDLARHVNQASKRKGAIAVYLEPWHFDMEAFLELKRNSAAEEVRTKDLHLAVWMNDLFMERVEAGGQWSLMCPNESQGLSDVYGEAFKKLYEEYEAKGMYRKKVNARDLFDLMLESQLETGEPYIACKDAVNLKSNQKNIGIIKSSNLCNEVNLVSTPEETAVCTLASISLTKFVKYFPGANTKRRFDFQELHKVARVATRNLDKVIDRTYNPEPQTELSNARHRPIGIGIQGLADVFLAMGLPFTCPEAQELNRRIMETIYHAALEASADLSEEFGPYSTFDGSPASKGILQYHMWNKEPSTTPGEDASQGAPVYDWAALIERIKYVGLRNSTLIALMPTASTSQLLGNTECFEPITSNIYARKTSVGDFIIINSWLKKDLLELGLWNDTTINQIMLQNGSVQGLTTLPDSYKELYKTVWELKRSQIIQMSADRGPFVCQSQSLNLYIDESTGQDRKTLLRSCLMLGWKLGLKSPLYYARSKPAENAIQITLTKDTGKEVVESSADIVKDAETVAVCMLGAGGPDCVSCSG